MAHPMFFQKKTPLRIDTDHRALDHLQALCFLQGTRVAKCPDGTVFQGFIGVDTSDEVLAYFSSGSSYQDFHWVF